MTNIEKKYRKALESLVFTEKYFFEDVYKISFLYCTFAPLSCKGMLILIIFTGVS